MAIDPSFTNKYVMIIASVAKVRNKAMCACYTQTMTKQAVKLSVASSASEPLAEETRRSMLSALRHRNFQLYFGGQLVSTSGTWMQTVAQSFLVFELTQSELWLGVVACAAGLPALVLSPFAGVIVERSARRRLLIFTQSAQMILAFILSVLTFTNTVQVWHVVVLALLLGVVNSIDAPARQSFVIDMVGREDLSSGIALNSLMFNLSRVVGPTAAGLALATVGTAWCFFLNGVSFLAVIISLFAMHVTPTN